MFSCKSQKICRYNLFGSIISSDLVWSCDQFCNHSICSLIVYNHDARISDFMNLRPVPMPTVFITFPMPIALIISSLSALSTSQCLLFILVSFRVPYFLPVIIYYHIRRRIARGKYKKIAQNLGKISVKVCANCLLTFCPRCGIIERPKRGGGGAPATLRP